MRRLFLLFFFLPFCLKAQTNTAAGNLTAQGASCLATNCVTLRFYPNTINSTITLSGTWSATVQFEASGDFGVTWVAAPGTTTSSTSNGTTQFTVGGFTNMRARISSFVSGTVVTTIVGSTQNVSNTTTIISGSGSVAAATPNLKTWYFATTCSGQTNCTAINADALFLTDCTTVSGSSTVTCPDALFKSSDVGKTAWGQSQGTGISGGSVGITATIACPITTIASVNSATSVTLTAANDCTANLTGNAVFAYGTKDGTTIKNAMSAQCANFIFPAGSNSAAAGTAKILVDQPFGNTLSSGCNVPFLTMSSAAPVTSGTTFILTPDFNWAGCTGNNGTISTVCFGAASVNMNYMSFTGLGLNGSGTCTSASNKTVAGPSNLVNQNYQLNLNGICPGTLGLKGIEIDCLDCTVNFGGAVNVGQFSCVMNSAGVSGFYNDCINDGNTVTGNSCSSGLGTGLGYCFGLWIEPGAIYQDFGSVWLENVINQGTLQSHGTSYYGGGTSTSFALINSNSGGVAKHTSDGDFINPTNSPAGTSTNGINNDFGAQTYYHNTLIRAGSVGGNAIKLSNDGNAAIFYDQCGNTYSGNTILNNAGSLGQVNNEGCSANAVLVVAAKTVLSAGWGTTAAVTALTGLDSPIQFTVTNSGTGQGASPTITYTFPTAYLVAPFSCTATQIGGTNATGTFTSSSLSTTGVTFTFSLTPTASSTEIVQVVCVAP